MTIATKIYSSRVAFHLDISTGGPIWPDPQEVGIARLLGGEIRMAGYPKPMVIAEKAVTILTRGATSTRWRDIFDRRNFALTDDFSAKDLRESAEHVAAYRGISLSSIEAAAAGWPDVAQTKWAAWRSKSALQNQSLASFADRLYEVIAFIDPIFTGSMSETGIWHHREAAWRKIGTTQR